MAAARTRRAPTQPRAMRSTRASLQEPPQHELRVEVIDVELRRVIEVFLERATLNRHVAELRLELQVRVDGAAAHGLLVAEDRTQVLDHLLFEMDADRAEADLEAHH